MPFRPLVLFLLLTIGLGATLSGRARPHQPTQPEYVAWVAQTLKRMQTVKVGMTRAELMRVFTTEGGISTPLQRVFVSRDCPYFKVEVRFRAVGRPERDSNGRVIMIEGGEDEIIEISRPYLQFSVID